MSLPSNINDTPASSLLSLSLAAANAAPIPLSTLKNESAVPTSAIPANSVKTHRRLASTGKTKRRLSDARDAASRPSPAALHTPTVALSLASLSLSTSPPLHNAHLPQSFSSASSVPTNLSTSVGDGGSASHDSAVPNDSATNPITISGATPNGRPGKKRGMDHKCESCSKIYRHPSCLIKHRWEHTPHWREASKFVLSKHQQVQLLEAAAILSHLSPSSSTGTSLPEDRSLWPSFLSGGSLPPPDGVQAPTTVAHSTSGSSSYSHPTSSSVPTTTLLGNYSVTRSASNSSNGSAGPRLHDYSVPLVAATSGGLTELRPGLLGMPTGGAGVPPTASIPVPVPTNNDSPYRHRDRSVGSYQSASYVRGAESGSLGAGTGGWSLPRSSMRSVSGSSRSRSGSASGGGSDEDSIADVDIEVDDYSPHHQEAYVGRRSTKMVIGPGMGMGWKMEDRDSAFSVREEDEDLDLDDEDEEGQSLGGRVGGRVRQLAARGIKGEDNWNGMEMEMEMDMD